MMAVAFIPTSCIVNYCRNVEGITDAEDIKDFIRLVRAIDKEFVTIRSEQIKQEMKQLKDGH